MKTLGPCDVRSFVAQSHTPCNRCVRFATTVASGRATLATKRTLLLTWAGLPPAGSHQLAAGALIRSPRRRGRAGSAARRDHRFGGFELVHALLTIDHAHTLLGTACISSASAALKLRSPGAAPL